ncbi:MAG: hypothetical protein AB1779_07475 [Candidatus Thermoplasmatota archaeon]
MGIFDKLKAVVGLAAKVSIEYPNQPVNIGGQVNVKVTVMSTTGGEVKSGGVFVDLINKEYGTVSGQGTCKKCGQTGETSVNFSREIVNVQIPIAPAFTLAPNETKVFEGLIQIPGNGHPTYHGMVTSVWSIRGRVDMFGNDPDSGFQTIVVK